MTCAPRRKCASIRWTRRRGNACPFILASTLFGDAVHRSDPGETTLAGVVIPPENTHAFVDRSEFAPRVTIPLHWGSWLGVTPTYTFRTTFYGAQDVNGTIVNSPMWRNTGEFSLDLRPAALERVWQRGTFEMETHHRTRHCLQLRHRSE